MRVVGAVPFRLKSFLGEMSAEQVLPFPPSKRQRRIYDRVLSPTSSSGSPQRAGDGPGDELLAVLGLQGDCGEDDVDADPVPTSDARTDACMEPAAPHGLEPECAEEGEPTLQTIDNFWRGQPSQPQTPDWRLMDDPLLDALVEPIDSQDTLRMREHERWEEWRIIQRKRERVQCGNRREEEEPRSL